MSRRYKVAGFEDAQQRWQVIRAKGKTRGYIALAVVAVLVIVIALVAKKNAAIVVAGLILAIVAVAVVLAIVGKQRSGLSLSPEWKPEADEFDDGDEADDQAGNDTEKEQARPVENPAEPVRRLDAQILGADLSKLGQVVEPTLAKSYAVGTLILENNKLVWEPGASSKAKGIEALTMEPGQVASVEQGALWGSWALLCVSGAADEEWCMRVPGSVDLSDAFAELGLTLRTTAR